MQDFKRRWLNGYLLDLREQSEKASKGVTSPSVGDIVLIKDNVPRLYWKIGHAIRIFQGEDSVTRLLVIQLGLLLASIYWKSTLTIQMILLGPKSLNKIAHH